MNRQVFLWTCDALVAIEADKGSGRKATKKQKTTIDTTRGDDRDQNRKEALLISSMLFFIMFVPTGDISWFPNREG